MQQIVIELSQKKKHNHQVTKTCDQIFIEWQHKKHHSYQWGSLPNSSPMSYFRASSSPIGHCWGFLRRWVSVDMAPRPVGLSRRCFEERLLHLGKLKLEDVPNRKENFYHQLNHVNHVDNFGNLKIRFHDQNWWFFFPHRQVLQIWSLFSLSFLTWVHLLYPRGDIFFGLSLIGGPWKQPMVGGGVHGTAWQFPLEIWPSKQEPLHHGVIKQVRTRMKINDISIPNYP